MIMLNVKKSKKKKLNYNLSLFFGSIILLAIILIMFMDERLISADPYSLDWGIEYVVDGETIKIEHPVKPNPVDKLGTDPLGRNVLSILISGTKTTVGIAFIATILRLILGVGIAIYKKPRKKLSPIQYLLSLLLGLLFPYFLLKISFFKQLELAPAIISYGIVIGFFGWLRVAGQVALEGEAYDKTQDKKLLIKAMLPHITISFFKEMGLSLLTLCFLGLLGISLGVSKYTNINTSWGFIPNYYPDWGGLLNITSQAIKREAYWLVISPLLFFLIGILGFLLVARGLSNNLERTGSIISSTMRNTINFLSPVQYIREIKSFSWNWGRVIVKSLILITILLLIFSSIESKEEYPINIDRAWQDLESINKIVQQYGANSHEAKEKIAKYILDELEAIYGLQPVFQEGFSQDIEDKGKNIAGYIWGRSSNNPLLLVVDYGKAYYENNTSIAALLELARSLGQKHHEGMASRTIVFLFVDGTLKKAEALKKAIGNKHIERRTFYLDLNYIGLGDKIYIDTSTVFSGNERHYRNIRLIKNNAKRLRIPIKQEYFYYLFENPQIFVDSKIAGLPISTVSIDEHYEYQALKEYNPNIVDKDNFRKHIQYIMNIATEYAWSDKPWLGDRY